MMDCCHFVRKLPFTLCPYLVDVHVLFSATSKITLYSLVTCSFKVHHSFLNLNLQKNVNTIRKKLVVNEQHKGKR
jgi:hypothetical protein